MITFLYWFGWIRGGRDLGWFESVILGDRYEIMIEYEGQKES